MNTWKYEPYRAKLTRNGEFFALVTEDGRNALPSEKVKQLLDDLCQTNLANAIRKHAAEMDSIMAGPASHERGQKIALSLGRLEQALRDSASTSPGSEVKADSGLPEPTVSPSPPAASTPALKKRKRRSSIS